MIINGGARKNELILSLDNKLFSDLSKNLKEMVKTIFPDIKNKDIISCKAVNSINHNMILAVNGISKNISVKTGNTSLIFKDKEA